MLTLRGVDIW